MILLLLFILLWLYFFVKVTKQEIAEYYGITKKTLDKWIRYLPTRICYKSYKRARKLSGLMAFFIYEELGYKEDQMPLYKGTIKAICETRYLTIRENISADQCGIDLEVYLKMNVFPPYISQKLVTHLGI